MTLEQLRTVIQTTRAKTLAIERASTELHEFMAMLTSYVDEGTLFSETIDVDAFVAIQAPIYTGLVNALTTAYDGLVQK